MTQFDSIIGRKLRHILGIQSEIISIEKMKSTGKYCVIPENARIDPLFFTEDEMALLLLGKFVNNFQLV